MLEGLKVFQGRTDGDSFAFDPKTPITRAEVATIIYRLATGDTSKEGASKYSGYATTKFPNDPSVTALANYPHMIGAIGYCANAEIIKGHDDGTFRANDNVSGYQVLAMILRAIGYDQNREFSGDEWQVKVASTAQKRGILNNLKSSARLGQDATREEVAEMLFQAAIISQVNYSAVIQDYTTVADGIYGTNPSLAWEVFRLKKGDDVTEWDKWGRPGYRWYRDNTSNKTHAAYVSSTYNSGETEVAIIKIEPVVTWTEQKRECDIAAACEFDGSKEFDLYVNSNTKITDKYTVVATDTVTPVGGQGRLTEVYYGSDVKRVVMIDTFLAQVRSVTKATLDAADHVIVPATMNLTVWDNVDNPATPAIDERSTTSPYAMTNGKTDWTFSVGDYILVQGHTQQNSNWTQTQKEQYAYEVRPLRLETDSTKKQVEDQGRYWEAPVKAESFTGTQSVVNTFNSSRVVDGTPYNDAMTFFKGQPIANATVKYTWFKDQYGNLIGIDEPGKTQYGVITGIYWAIGVGDTSQTNGKGNAIANVTLADGTKTTMAISKFNIPYGATSNWTTRMVPGSDVSAANGYSVLAPYYDFSSTAPMSADGTPPAPDATKYKTGSGSLMVAPYVDANISTTIDDDYDIIARKGQLGQLFKFTTDASGSITATEVAGNGSGDEATASSYDDVPFATLWNGTVDANKATVNKGDTFIKYRNDGTNDQYIFINNNTKFMIQGYTGNMSSFSHGDVTGGISIFTSVAEMPGGKLDLVTGAEIDWVDYNRDGIADVVYTVAQFTGNIHFGLFYATRVQSSWDYTTGKGTIIGHLDGAPESEYVIYNADVYNWLVNSIPATWNSYVGYPGRLFGLKLENDAIVGVSVIDTLVGGAGTNYKAEFLDSGKIVGISDDATYGAAGATPVAAGNRLATSLEKGAGFLDGPVDGGNSYSRSTRAVYFDGSQLSYNSSNGTLTTKDGTVITEVSGASNAPGGTTTTTNADGSIASTTNITFTNVNSNTIVTGGGQIYNLDNCYVTIVFNEPTNNFDTNRTRLALQVYLTQKTNTPSTQAYTYSVSDERTVAVASGNSLTLNAVTPMGGSASKPTLSALNGTHFFNQATVDVKITVRAIGDTGTTEYTAKLGNNISTGELTVGTPVTWVGPAPTFKSNVSYYITMNIVDEDINNGTALPVWSGIATCP